MGITKKQFLYKYNGKKFIRFIENFRDKEYLKADLLKQMEINNIPANELIEEVDCWEVRDRKFFYDKRKQNQIGIIKFMSRDYTFHYDGHDVYGVIPKAMQFVEDSFYIFDLYGNRITYTLT